jgi:DNA-binding SARP family transcriptional activator/TolB-like protein
VLKLRTLGAVYLALEDGQPLGGAASQKRALALLALLAVAGDSGLSRDKIVALLWPESDEERARHSLTQLLYAARRAVGIDDLFAINGDVRLNAQQITSDVQEMETALDAEALETAAMVYQGPFLDGFYVAGSAAFEQWAEAERLRLAGRAAAAVERLGDAAESGGDARSAVEWRRRLVALRPFDSRATVKLMTSLAAVGDRAGALQHASIHTTLLREELGIDPDPVVAELAERLREPVMWTPEPAIAMPEPTSAVPERAAIEHAAVTVPNGASAPSALAGEEEGTPAGSAIGVWQPPLRLRRRWLPSAGLAALVVVLLLVVVWRGRRQNVDALAVHQDVVVAPFRVSGANASLHYLREGMVELLSTRLADDTAARSVDAGAVLAAWRAAGLSSAMDVARDTVVKLARQLGASRVVLGSVVGAPSRVIITASVVVARTGAVSAEASVEGPADSLTWLVDRLAARLLVSEAGDSEHLADQTTTSLSALRAYLDGQAAYVRRDYTSAQRFYGRALEGDSAFALAALHLALVSERLGDHDGVRRAVARAWPWRTALPERDLAQLVALGGPRYPAPSPATEQVNAWRRLVRTMPDRAEGWTELGARIFHDGASAGIAAPDAEVRAALTRALQLNADTAAAQRYLFQLDSRAGSGPLPSRIAPGDARFSVRRPFAPFLRWHIAQTRGDTATQRALRDTLWRLGRANLRAIVQASQFDAIGLDDGARASRILMERVGTEQERRDALLTAHALANNRGRPRSAQAIVEQLRIIGADMHAPLRLRLLDALYGQGDTAAAVAAAAELARVLSAAPVTESVASSSDDRCVLAQWRLTRGDTSGVAGAIVALRGTVPAENAGPAAACAELVESWLAVATHRTDARARLDRTASLAFTAVTAGEVSAYAPVLLARLYEHFGEHRRALEMLRRRPYMSGWPAYLATAYAEEGRLAEAVADSASARRAYERYLALRDAPEPELTASVEDVRRRLERLGADSVR